MNDARLKDLFVPKLLNYGGRRGKKSIKKHLDFRYIILDALNKNYALGWADLLRKTRMNDNTLRKYLKILIKERAIKKWNFDRRRILYSYCFVPDYKVREIYERKYQVGPVSRFKRKRNLKRLYKKLFSDK